MNSYGQLADALKIYLNPTLELIQAEEDLSKHCYYHLKKYAKVTSMFWTLIESDDFNQILEWSEKQKATEIPDKTKLLKNLKLAQQKDDHEYLNFLLKQQPKKTITFKKKKAVIDAELAKKLAITDEELEQMSSVQLKLFLHRYIANQNLQEDNEVMVDQIISELLTNKEDNLVIGKPVHYFDILKHFNKRFLRRFNDTQSNESSNDESSTQ